MGDSEEGTYGLLDLPPGVLAGIMGHLSVEALASCCLACSALKRVALQVAKAKEASTHASYPLRKNDAQGAVGAIKALAISHATYGHRPPYAGTLRVDTLPGLQVKRLEALLDACDLTSKQTTHDSPLVRWLFRVVDSKHMALGAVPHDAPNCSLVILGPTRRRARGVDNWMGVLKTVRACTEFPPGCLLDAVATRESFKLTVSSEGVEPIVFTINLDPGVAYSLSVHMSRGVTLEILNP
jgi:hypothetical protein